MQILDYVKFTSNGLQKIAHPTNQALEVDKQVLVEYMHAY